MTARGITIVAERGYADGSSIQFCYARGYPGKGGMQVVTERLWVRTVCPSHPLAPIGVWHCCTERSKHRALDLADLATSAQEALSVLA